MLSFIKNLSAPEIIIIVIILVALFGAKIMRLMGKITGETIKEAKNIKKEFVKAVKGDKK